MSTCTTTQRLAIRYKTDNQHNMDTSAQGELVADIPGAPELVITNTCATCGVGFEVFSAAPWLVLDVSQNELAPSQSLTLNMNLITTGLEFGQTYSTTHPTACTPS